MQTVVSAADAKATFSDLLRRVEAGEEVIVTRNGHQSPSWFQFAPERGASYEAKSS
jgi:Antitoxin Phd_YefM, type II toxin-antitoxin system